MGRSKVYQDPINHHMDMERSLLERVRAEALRREVSANFLINRAIERALDLWEGQELP